MVSAKEFFDLQLSVAEKVVALSGLPLARALLEYTNLYVRLGLGRGFDPAHPTWRAYVAGLEGASDAGAWTYRFYLTRAEATTAPPVDAAFGCFAYARHADGRLRLHFRNVETDGSSSLSAARVGQRRADLTALFGHVRRSVTGPCRVAGASWLYNIDAYRRLFPPAYLATARVIGRRFQHMPLWGQFLRADGQLREPLAREFLERLAGCRDLDDLDRCFPFQVLAVEAPVQAFYEFYRQ